MKVTQVFFSFCLSLTACNMHYYLSIGTNISPEYNAAQIIKLLATAFGEIHYFPFVYTQPQGMRTHNTFLNSVAVVKSELDSTEFKQQLNTIETTLGRDRTDPLRSKKDRTADIDILGSSEQWDSQFFHQFNESYIRGVVRPGTSARFANLTAFGLPPNDLHAQTGLATVESENFSNPTIPPAAVHQAPAPIYFSLAQINKP
ncbi:hypothetical protein TDB9533_03831 [Thalassocella blandensis]|nr:hypothetical protein TDB9533_03831 [Thalassocella blandensis]